MIDKKRKHIPLLHRQTTIWHTLKPEYHRPEVSSKELSGQSGETLLETIFIEDIK